jgi:hypothetical protein
MTGVTFDAGALIALDRDDRRVITLLARAAELRAPVTIRRHDWSSCKP